MKQSCSYLFLLMALILSIKAVGQEPYGCGDKLNAEGLQYYQFLLNAQNKVAFNLSGVGIANVPVHYHFIRRADNSTQNGLSVAQQTAAADRALDTVNLRFKPANIRFFRCLEPNIILNSVMHDSVQVGSASQQALTNPNSNNAVINIYFTEGVYDGSSNRCGYARFPSQPERLIFMNYSCLGDRNTFAHELGHYFSLLHTQETFMGAENVTRNPADPCYDCLVDGDFLCDTPADAGLQNPDNSFQADASCAYTGTGTDACGVAYAPDTRNIMSYTRPSCGWSFTPGQLSLIQSAYTTTRMAQLDTVVCSQSICYDNVTLPNITVMTTKRVNAQQTISSAEIIMTSGADNVIYAAGNFILLTPGFHAKSGSNFRAVIDGCYIPFQQDAEERERPIANVVNKLEAQIAPNPNSGHFNLQFKLQDEGPVSAQMLNMQGKMVHQLLQNDVYGAGSHAVPFELGGNITPGLYYIAVKAPGYMVTLPVVFIRN